MWDVLVESSASNRGLKGAKGRELSRLTSGEKRPDEHRRVVVHIGDLDRDFRRIEKIAVSWRKRKTYTNWKLPKGVVNWFGITPTQRHLGSFRSEDAKQKCRSTTIAAVCAARYTAVVVVPRHF